MPNKLQWILSRRLSAFSSNPTEENDSTSKKNGGKKERGITERLTFEKIADIERPEKFRTPVVPVTESRDNGAWIGIVSRPTLASSETTSICTPAAIRSPPSEKENYYSRNERREREREREIK